MKNLLGLLFVFMLLVSCDDGNVTVQDISFEDVAAANCGQIVYKVKNNEILLLKMSDLVLAFTNDVTLPNQPRIFSIGSSNSVSYRAYNGAASGDNICGSPPATKPDVIEEWKATGGTIEITTTISRSTNTTTNATTIIGYNHFVVFRNVTFEKPSGSQFYDTFNFGFVKTSFTPLNLTFTNTAKVCLSGTNNIITNKIGSVVLMSYDNVPNNISSTLGVKTAAITSTNQLFYRVFGNIDPINYSCNATFPVSDNLQQEWKSTSGTVEINTETNGGTSLKHTITLKGVTLSKGNSTFYLGDSFNFGEYFN